VAVTSCLAADLLHEPNNQITAAAKSQFSLELVHPEQQVDGHLQRNPNPVFRTLLVLFVHNNWMKGAHDADPQNARKSSATDANQSPDR